jgi:DNA primase
VRNSATVSAIYTFRGRCPFYDDSTPSFVVDPKTQSFH